MKLIPSIILEIIALGLIIAISLGSGYYKGFSAGYKCAAAHWCELTEAKEEMAELEKLGLEQNWKVNPITKKLEYFPAPQGR